MAGAQKKEWLINPAWKDNRITSNQKTLMWFLWFFAGFWNLISFPVALALPKELAKGNYLILIAVIFPVIGLMLLYWAIKVTGDWRRFGEIFVQLDPFPGAIGGHVGGSIELPVRYTPDQLFYVQLHCLRSYKSGSGKSRETHESSLWQEDGIAQLEATALGTRLKFRFDVPNNLPQSEAVSDDYHHWRLDIESKNPAIKFSRRYDIPVYATGEHSHLLNQNSATHPVIQELDEASLESVCKLEKIHGGVQLYFHPLRNWPTKLFLLVFGSIFTGAGVGMYLFKDVSFLFCAIFAGVGGLCVLGALYGLCNSLSVRLDKQGLEYKRKLLGVVVRNLQIPRRDISHLRLKESYSSQGGGKHETVYAVKAKLNMGAEITVAESLRGRGVAELMLETLAGLSGLRRGV